MKQQIESIYLGPELRGPVDILKALGHGRFSAFVREAFEEKWRREGLAIEAECRELLKGKISTIREER